jgi:hypothetical protein
LARATCEHIAEAASSGRVRNASTWLTCLHTTSRLLVAVAQTAVAAALAKPFVSVRAILSQLEE